MAQDEMNGRVYYQQIDKFEYKPTGRVELDQYAKTMPTEFKYEKVLHFNGSKTLYEKSENPDLMEISRKDRWIMHRSQYGKNPKPSPEKIYCDFEKGEKTELVDFMTRPFLVESSIEKYPWKFTNNPKKILDYTCMSAETSIDSQQIVAWFTPQIPVSAGPANYYGLPGLIMAVEKNGETIYLASKVLMAPEENRLIKPKEGKKVSQEKLDKIIEEKVEEFKKQGKGKGGRRGHFH
jgi:GLPGLI family protein